MAILLNFFCIYALCSETSISSIDFDAYVAPPVTMDSIRITYYEPVESQCYGNPLVTATNAKIDLSKLKNGEIRWVAISRDLEETFAMGDSIDIYIREGHPWNGKYLINDRTSARLKKTVDILSNTFNGGCYRGRITGI